MILSSIEFPFFLALLLGVLAVARSESGRRWILIAASYLAYAWWDWRACGLLLLVTLLDWAIALRMAACPERAARRPWLVLGITVDLGLLAFFKYTGFLLGNLQPLLGAAGFRLTVPAIALPVGISFYTFQSISYLVDVERGTVPARKSLRDVALFVSFFPQLLAGPIVRGGEFLPQLDADHPLERGNLREGFERFLRGFTKKMLFADTLAIWVNPVFRHPAAYDPWTCRLAALAYAGQIYYDFSGYTDMAIGVARMLGIRYPENFRSPYLSLSIAEFWQRWHITLSHWLRDYLFLPLAYAVSRRVRADRVLGLRAETWSYASAIAVTMLLAGLWHGAAWTFVAWGGLHGIALAVHRIVRERRGRRAQGRYGRAGKVASWALTFAFLVATWVVFRAPDFATARTMFARMASFDGSGIRWPYVPGLAVLVAATLSHLWALARGGRGPVLDLRRPLAWPALAALLLVLLLFAPTHTSPFIYAQF